MSDKAVLVMDMPGTCEKCPFCDLTCYTCEAFAVLGKSYTYEVPEEEYPVPDWCPLKKMPEKKNYEALSDKNPMNAWGNGWNACIDEILEECKNE